MPARRIAPILVATIALTSGCGPRTSNRSPTPEQDPGRYARALQDAEDARLENQEAEANFYRRLGRTGVVLPDAEPQPLAPSPEALELVHSQTGAGTS